MSKQKPRSIEELVKFALQRRFTESRRLRKLLDRRKEVRQIFELDEKYYKNYDSFIEIYNKAIEGKSAEEIETSRETIDMGALGGEGKIQIRSAAKIVGDRANFRQIKNFYTKLIPELKKGYQFGHKDVSILRANIALVLDGDATSKVLTDIERKRLLALYKIVKEIDKIEDITGAPSKIDLVQMLGDIAEAGPDISAEWQKDVNIVKGISGSIRIEAEYEELNQYKGRLSAWVGEIFSSVIQEDEKIFNKYLGEIDISKLKGSPDIEKDIENAFLNYLGEGRKKNYKAKKPAPTKDQASKSTKTKKTKAKRKTVKNAKTARNTSPSAKPLQLLGVLNQQLPSTVAKNMGDPALNYRTGRFASSVTVTDIATTAQGFPSIGYTYRKNPYQTFEKGFAQGSPDRDPRKLIDRSIREIAAQFAIGRFYTRRV